MFDKALQMNEEKGTEKLNGEEMAFQLAIGFDFVKNQNGIFNKIGSVLESII